MLTISLLGRLRVTDGAGTHAPPGAKLRTILAVLALFPGEPASRDELIEELGLTESTRNASNTLQAHIVRLRHWLDERYAARRLLVTSDRGYRLDVAAVQVDAHRFEAAVRHAETIPAGHDEAVTALLEPALQLWHGRALADAGEGPICRRAAGALEEQRVGAQERLIDARLAGGREREAISDLQRLLTDHPFRERLWEQLMLAQYRSGRQVHAVESYHRIRGLLDTELGLEPGPGLRTRLHEILTHAPGLNDARLLTAGPGRPH